MEGGLHPLCPECGSILEVSDVKCFYCHFTLPYRNDDETIQCEFCQCKLLFGDEECYNCHSIYPVEFWRNYYVSEISGMIAVETDDEEAALIEKISQTIIAAEETVLCCDRLLDHCSCDAHLDAAYCYDLHISDVYNTGSACMNCAWGGSPACGPLRNVTKLYLENDKQLPKSIPLINVCSNFLLDPLSTRKD